MAKRHVSEKRGRSEPRKRAEKPEHRNSNGSMVEKTELNAKLVEHYDRIFHDEFVHARLFEGSGYSNYGYWNEGTGLPP